MADILDTDITGLSNTVDNAAWQWAKDKGLTEITKEIEDLAVAAMERHRGASHPKWPHETKQLLYDELRRPDYGQPTFEEMEQRDNDEVQEWKEELLVIMRDMVSKGEFMTEEERQAQLDKEFEASTEGEAEAAPEATVIEPVVIPDRVNTVIQRVAEADGVSIDVNQMYRDMAKLQNEAAVLRRASMRPVVGDMTIEATGEIPEGKVEWVRAKDLFLTPSGKRSEALNFDVPYWTWDGPHPQVPERDPHYLWPSKALSAVLYGIASNENVLLEGHTGTGKTTLIEQVCAYLNYPFERVNMDSEITRMDLIGREILKANEHGGTESQFVDGILPRAIPTPTILCVDEVFFCRADVAYVMQRMYEGNGIVITEDGGRFAKPHPYFRIMSTDNTKGQGDEFGAYQGAKPQSMAFLDRMPITAHIDYIQQSAEEDLLIRKIPALAGNDYVRQFCDFANKARHAFVNGEIMLPVSHRGVEAACRMFMHFKNVMSEKNAARYSLDFTMMGKASERDRQVLDGIRDRVMSL